MFIGPGWVRLVATALGGFPVCSFCLAGSDGVICSPGDLTFFSKKEIKVFSSQSKKSKSGDLIKSIWKRQSRMFDCLSTLFADKVF